MSPRRVAAELRHLAERLAETEDPDVVASVSARLAQLSRELRP